jgi:protein involved in polysaccharide export with SLBB domain
MTRFFLTRTMISRAVPYLSAAGLVCFAVFAQAIGQTNDRRGNNNPYSPSPDRKTRPDVPTIKTPVGTNSGEVAFVTQTGPQARPTVAQQTFKIVKAADMGAVKPTELYKVGVGDVLFVNLKNSSQSSGYYTVRGDGTIDFPLAGEKVIVADQTVEDIEEMLASGITLFPDPQVEVKVREYGSHKITVSGMVDRPGEKNLQREAIPLFVIRAEAIANSRATKAIVTRAPLLKAESYDLSDSKTDDVLIYPGNSVEFTGDGGSRNSGPGFYFISGGAVSPGQKDMAPGLTLYQAVVASGGAKGDPKKAVIRRKNESGVFSVFEHNLRAIKSGKAVDPAVSPGDVIEIR